MIDLSMPRRTVEQKLMTASVEVHRATTSSTSTFDEATGTYVTERTSTQIYSGPAYIYALSGIQRGESDRASTALGLDTSVDELHVCVLHDAAEIEPGDEVRIITSLDSYLVGKSTKVQRVAQREINVWRDLTVEQIDNAHA